MFSIWACEHWLSHLKLPISTSLDCCVALKQYGISVSFLRAHLDTDIIFPIQSHAGFSHFTVDKLNDFLNDIFTPCEAPHPSWDFNVILAGTGPPL